MEYLFGLLILAAIWLGFGVSRKDLLRPMMWSGLAYVVLMSIGFIVVKIIFPDIPVERTLAPGYWYPDTLFDLNRRTGGYGIEDALFGFLVGGIATAAYEIFFRRHLSKRHVHHVPHTAILFAGFAGTVTAAVNVNLIWAMMAFTAVGTVVIWIQRPDLIRHSLLGGCSFLIVYIGVFLCFTILFPFYISETYNLPNFIGIHPLGIPLEEYLWAFSFGLMWAPIYEYMKDLR